MKSLSLAHAAKVLAIAEAAGLDTSKLPNCSPWSDALRPTPLLEHLQQAILEKDPAFAEELMAEAGIEKEPSLRLAAALHRQEVALANGLEPERLPADLQMELEALHPGRAAQARLACEQALLEQMAAEAENMAASRAEALAAEQAARAAAAQATYLAEQRRRFAETLAAGRI